MEKIKIADKKSKMMEMEPGDYYWCACGRSKNQPFCDGSHQGTGIQPLHTKIEEKKQVFWCMCKHSASKPFCDGSHRQL
ncbi:MAG: CDGSH iron-sulfur domain-containing protein [Bacteroidales bacterium]|nr:CDGSH iron-sulfur domain-containing protein [Bacteroidales bacterium]